MSANLETQPGEKSGWYPRIYGRRWHYFRLGESASICGVPFKPYKIGGVEVALTPETVPFRDKCTKCERVLTVAFGSGPLGSMGT